jgi:Protein of unknown function (DUF3224)
MRHRQRRRLLLVALAVVLASVGAAAAGASPPAPVSGTFATTSSTFESVRMAGNNLIIEVSGTVSYTGTLTGTSTIHGRLIGHFDEDGNIHGATFHDVEVFTGTVNGVPGTITLNLNGSNGPDLAVQATATIVDATGDLAGLRGTIHELGTVNVPLGPFGSYSGKLG